MQRFAHQLRHTTLPLSTNWLIAGILFLLAAGLRVWGVQWALPFVVHADEAHIVDLAVGIVKTGDLNPHWAVYPALMIYLQAAVDLLNLWWGTWRGFYVGPESLPDHNHTFALAPGVYLWGRTFSALIGGATVAGLYRLGAARLGRGAGLVAALLLLTSPVHIEKFALPDDRRADGRVGVGRTRSGLGLCEPAPLAPGAGGREFGRAVRRRQIQRGLCGPGARRGLGAGLVARPGRPPAPRRPALADPGGGDGTGGGRGLPAHQSFYGPRLEILVAQLPVRGGRLPGRRQPGGGGDGRQDVLEQLWATEPI